MSEYTPTTEEVRINYIGTIPELAGDRPWMEHRPAEFNRWLAEYTRQQREEAVTDLENGVLPEGYMIVNVENLSEAVIRARKGIVTEAEALKFAAEFLRSKRFHVYKSQSGIGWMALNTINGAARALEAEARLRS